jgi:hypothetical protein
MTRNSGVSIILVSIFTTCFFYIDTSFGQITTAVPFLLISTSPEANGQGSTSVSRMTDDNYSIITNPAHLGLLSLQSNASISFYPTKTNWLPALGLKDLTFNTLAINGDINLKEYFDCPLSIGIAYSRVDLNLGTFYQTSSTGPEITGTIDAEEHADAISISTGTDFGIKVALGITFRRIESNLAPWGAGYINASAWSRDYGILINVPVTKLAADKLELLPQIAPIFDISFGSALTNIGEKMSYIDRAQADPLPRNISMGTSLEFGFKYVKPDYKILSFVWSRQADNILVERSQDGSFNYRGLFGDLDFMKNIIKGEWTDKVEVSQGWEISLGEFFFIRGGSFVGNGYSDIKTNGFGLSTSGIFRFLQVSLEESRIIAYIAEHIALRYNHSEYSAGNHPLSGTDFSSLSLLVKF